jgi:hypothetical protein
MKTPDFARRKKNGPARPTLHLLRDQPGRFPDARRPEAKFMPSVDKTRPAFKAESLNAVNP